MNFKFAHLADLHLGGWREKNLTKLNLETFQKAVDDIIQQNVDFCIFAGDIFNSASPPLDIVNAAAQQLYKLKQAGIPVYSIGGSHDYSATGKSYLNLLETTGMLQDVAKWRSSDKNEIELETYWHNNSIILTGVIGKKNGLDALTYKKLTNQSLPEDAFKIFVFHTTLNDIKPDFLKNAKSQVTSSSLPKGFNYYAGGHVHTHIDATYDKGRVVYPGPLFPNSVVELEREKPAYIIASVNNGEVSIKRKYVETRRVITIQTEAKKDSPLEIKQKLQNKCSSQDFDDAIVIVRVTGVVDGSISDIGLVDITKQLYSQGAFQVLKQTHSLTSSQLEQIQDSDKNTQISVEEIEEEIITSNIEDQTKQKIIKSLLSLDLEKQEEEKNTHYEQRVKQAIQKCL